MDAQGSQVPSGIPSPQHTGSWDSPSEKEPRVSDFFYGFLLHTNQLAFTLTPRISLGPVLRGALMTGVKFREQKGIRE